MFHKNVVPADNHPIHSWLVADATAFAALVPVLGDEGKIAIQLSPYVVYLLKDSVAPDWVVIYPVADPLAASIAIVDAGGFYTGADVETALQEIGTTLVSVTASISTLTTGLALAKSQCLAVAISDEATNITIGTAKVTFHMPFDFTLSEVQAGLSVAQAAGSIVTFDINEAGVSILSTKLTIDNTETTSITAATPAVISDAALAKGAVITIDIDQVGTALAKGAKIYLIGHRT